MNDNIFKTLLKNKHVNNYTKLLIMLNNYDYYKDYYIPNKKLENIIKTDRRKIRDLLHQMEDDGIIILFYKGKKRFFRFIEKEERKKPKVEVFDYDWLNEK